MSTTVNITAAEFDFDQVLTPTGPVNLLPRAQFEQLVIGRNPSMPAFIDGGRGLYRNTDERRRPQIDAANDWDAVRCFLRDKALAGSPHTVRAYEKECLRLFLWCRFVALKAFSDLNREDAQNYQRFLQAPTTAFVLPHDSDKGYTPGPMMLDGELNPNWRPFRKKSLSDGSIRTAMGALKSLSKYLVNADYLTSSPFTLGQLAKADKNATQRVRKRVLRDVAKDAVDAVIEALPDTTPAQRMRALRHRYVFDVFYFLGLRMDEALSASMGDFFVGNERCWFRTVGKGDKERTVPVPTPFLQSLSDYRLALDLESPFPMPDETTPLITRVNGVDRVKDTQIRRLLQALFRGAADHLEQISDGDADAEAAASVQALRKATPHWLRHTYATDLFQAGADPRHIQENMGHASMDTTLIYNDNDDTLRHDDTQKLSDVTPTAEP